MADKMSAIEFQVIHKLEKVPAHLIDRISRLRAGAPPTASVIVCDHAIPLGIPLNLGTPIGARATEARH
jgi:hypothetical protein